MGCGWAYYQAGHYAQEWLPYGVPVLKRLLLLVHLDLHERVLIRQIRLLARRDLALTRFGLEKLPCQLDFMVYKGLVRFGWHAEDLLWVMGGFSFTSVDCMNDQMWKKISHMVRESIRKWHYDQLVHLKRHEFEGMEIPPFDPWRIQVVRKWIRKDSVALMLATGSLGSGATWKRAQPSRKIFLARYVAVSTCIGTTIGDAGQTMNLRGTLCSGGSFGLDQLLIFHWWRSSLRMLARWLKGTVKLQRAARTLYSLANRTLLCEGIWGRRGLLFGD